MPNDLKAKLTETRRQHILEAAVAVIAEQGFQKTTVRQIARRAGVADGTIYNYFKNKDAILLAIIKQVTAAEVRDIHFADARQIDFDVFTKGYVAERMAEMNASIPQLRVIFSESLVNPALAREVYDQIYGPAFAVAEAYFVEQQRSGHLPAETDPKILTRLFAAPLLGITLLRLLGDPHIETDWEGYVEGVGEMLLRVLSAKS